MSSHIGVAPTSTADLYTDLRETINAALADDSELPLEQALAAIADTTCTILSCDYAAIVVRDPDGGSQLIRSGRGAADHLAGLEGLVARVVYDGDTIRTPDTALESAALGLPAEEPPLRELLAVPVRSGGKVSGGLFASAHRGGRPFRREAEYDAQTIGTAIGFLVDRARLVAGIQRRERWLEASTELTRELVADVHPNPMQALVERLLDVAGVDLATVIIPSVDEAKMVITSVAGERAHLLERRVLERAGTVHSHLFDEREPLIVNLGGVSVQRELLDQLGVEAALMVPMPGLAGQGGVLSLYRYPDRPAFSQAEVRMATTFATHIVLAMQLASARASRERTALLAERDRIARDLHDNIIQQLFATGMALQSTASELDRDSGEKLYRAIDELDRTILQIRTTIYRLTAPTLDDGSGLRQRIEHVISRLEEMLGFPVEIDISGPIDFGVGDDVGRDVVAVLQETLTNVAKHAEASSVHVSITLREGVVTLVVADNGHGIGDSSRRSGLANLRSRAEARGGAMTTESGSNGTRITWSAPAAD